MSGGLFALLDDVAALVRLAAASVDDVGLAASRAGTKAAGVIIDDAAVTPQYVQGLAAKRELPIIKQIAVGSLRNKLLIILPLALLISQFAEWLLPYVLMVGGAYLSFEGAEKIWEKLRGKSPDKAEDAPAILDPGHEKKVVGSAIRTDLILSAEIMVIALNEVKEEPFLTRAVILAAVGVAITVLIYGVVGVIVKVDDMGLALSRKARTDLGRRFGLGMVKAMPGILAVIGAVGTAAMLWVGGHILLAQSAEAGWHTPYDLVHDLEHAVHELLPFAGVAWFANTLASAVVGLVFGAVVATVVHFLPFGHGDGHGEAHGDGHGEGKDGARATGTTSGSAPGSTPGNAPGQGPGTDVGPGA